MFVINSMSTAVGSTTAELPHSQSASDLQECVRLPLVIREKDVEYQVRGLGVCPSGVQCITPVIIIYFSQQWTFSTDKSVLHKKSSCCFMDKMLELSETVLPMPSSYV